VWIWKSTNRRGVWDPRDPRDQWVPPQRSRLWTKQWKTL